jgi:hypothetical protein
MIEERGIEGVRVLQGFVSLSSRHPASVINRASRLALQGRLSRLRPLRELCKRLREAEPVTFIDSHPIIRPLSEYQALLVSLDPKPGGDLS